MTVLLLSSSDGEFWGDVCSERYIIHLHYFVMRCSFNCVRHVVYYLGGSGIAVPFKDYERLMTSEPMRDLFTFSTF